MTPEQVYNLASGHAGVAGTISVGIPLQAASHRSLEVFASDPSFIARVARILEGTLSAHSPFTSHKLFSSASA